MDDRARGQPSASILLVDDEQLVRPLLARGLRHAGHIVTDADSAEAALALLADRARSLDLLITDVQMPGMDGVELARRARALRPGLRVVLISGAEVSGDAAHLADRLLLKPFRRPELLAAVDEVLASAS